jgi:HSP20 family molecular chaperone IbpA
MGRSAGKSLHTEGFAMTRTVFFDSPFLLGFEQTRELIERTARAATETYPPYNVEERGETGIRISLAVAGFSADQLTVDIENNQLTVSGKRDGDGQTEAERSFLHRGIAARSFSRSFVLADGLEVEGAELEHGLLHIDLKRPDPETRVKHIPIRSSGHQAEGGPNAGG